MIFPTADSAQDFAKWIAENKPHLIEIEEEIQKIGQFGDLEIKLTVRAGVVEKVNFYGGRCWLKGKKDLTQQDTSVK